MAHTYSESRLIGKKSSTWWLLPAIIVLGLIVGYYAYSLVEMNQNQNNSINNSSATNSNSEIGPYESGIAQ